MSITGTSEVGIFWPTFDGLGPAKVVIDEIVGPGWVTVERGTVIIFVEAGCVCAGVVGDAPAGDSVTVTVTGSTLGDAVTVMVGGPVVADDGKTIGEAEVAESGPASLAEA